MQLEYSLSSEEADRAVLELRPTPLRLAARRNLNQFEEESGLYGLTRVVRRLLTQDLCGSVLNLVRLSATLTRDPIPVLVCPGSRVVDAGNLVPACPTVYVIHSSSQLRQYHHPSLCASTDPFQLDMAALAQALANPDQFQPVPEGDLKALRRGELPCELGANRLAVWQHHVHRLRIDADSGRPLGVVARSSRYFADVTTLVVTPLLKEMQERERALIKTFLAPLNDQDVRQTLRRPTALEKQRNRCQAVESYPFLESIWHTDKQTESPVATSLIAELDPRARAKIRRIIDDGQPLVDILACELRLDPWMIDHLRRHWPAYLAVDRSHYPDRRWDMGAMLSLWTPETAPQSLEELERLEALTYRRHDCLTPLYRSIDTPVSSEDRRSLRKLIYIGPFGERMLAYLEFIYSLNRWISTQLGQDFYADLPHLLGAKNVNDWWLMARRWYLLNANLQRRTSERPAAAEAAIDLQWPALLTRVESIGPFTFRSLNSCADLATESAQMQHCASTYVARCALGDSYLLHIAQGDTPIGTLEVRKGMYGDNIKLLLEHAQGIDHEPLSPEAEQAVHQFQDACNDGRIALNPEALQPRSLRMDTLAPMLQLQCIDYPTWVRSRLGDHFFDLHAHVTGPDLIEQYRTALELQPGANGSLYQLALRAVTQSRRLNRESREYLEMMVNAS